MTGMANLTLIYGMRLLPSEEAIEVGDALVTLKNGKQAHVTMHVLEGSREEIEKKDLAAYLEAMRTTMASELGRSFFITRQMDQQFRGQVTDGLLLPILQLLVRTNHTILGFRYVRLDEQGQLIDRTLDYHAPTRYGNKGVEIE